MTTALKTVIYEAILDNLKKDASSWLDHRSDKRRSVISNPRSKIDIVKITYYNTYYTKTTTTKLVGRGGRVLFKLTHKEYDTLINAFEHISKESHELTRRADYHQEQKNIKYQNKKICQNQNIKSTTTHNTTY